VAGILAASLEMSGSEVQEKNTSRRPTAPQYHISVSRPRPTLSRQSTRSSAIEGLWGTSDSWTDRLRGNCGGEGRGGGGHTPLQPRNRSTAETQGSGRESWSRIEPGAVTGAVICSLLQSPARQEL
jgi:hypothetical protein